MWEYKPRLKCGNDRFDRQRHYELPKLIFQCFPYAVCGWFSLFSSGVQEPYSSKADMPLVTFTLSRNIPLQRRGSKSKFSLHSLLFTKWETFLLHLLISVSSSATPKYRIMETATGLVLQPIHRNYCLHLTSWFSHCHFLFYYIWPHFHSPPLKHTVLYSVNLN